MYLDKATPWEQYPKNLRFNEVQNPLLVIREFFNAGWPKDHRKDLKQWHYYVVHEEHFKNKRHGPGSLLFTYELNLKLVEAMYLLLLSNAGNGCNRTEITSVQLENEQQEWIYFPNNLSNKEIKDPYKAVGKSFKNIMPDGYRQYLHEWLHVALYNHAADENMTSAEIITIYENLLRLQSAAWIIHQRALGENLTCNAQDRKDKYACSSADKVAQLIQLKEINSELTAAEAIQLEDMTTLILTRAPSVRMVVFLGKQGNPLTYYLLILTADKDKTAEHQVCNMIEDNCKDMVNVFAIVHKSGSAIEGINSRQRFWSKALSKGNIIYKASELELPEIQQISGNDLLERAEFHWERWGKQGKEFLKGAQHYQADGNDRIAAFLLHQSVESILKAIIQAVSGYRVRIHNLSRLLRMTFFFTDAFKDVFALGSAEDSEVFNLLQNSYSQSRYKNEFNPDKETITVLIKKVSSLIDLAERVQQQFVKNVKCAIQTGLY